MATTKRSAKVYTYEYPRAMNTVDSVVFGFTGDALKILLIKRVAIDDDGKPNVFGGWWSLPGGFVKVGESESLDDAARRELVEETGLKVAYLEQLYTFGDPGRDPRGHVISVAYYALVKALELDSRPRSDAAESGWFDVRELPKNLAFDHAKIIEIGLQRIRGKVRYQPIGFELLPEKFSLLELRRLYEAILGKTLDMPNFRRKILSLNVLTPLEEYVRHAKKPSQLYRFDAKAYHRLVRAGFNFEV